MTEQTKPTPEKDLLKLEGISEETLKALEGSKGEKHE